MDAARELKIRNCDQSCALILRVYHYLKAEYQFTLFRQQCACDVSHLRDITQRTADAVGVDISTVRHVLETKTTVPDYNFNFVVKETKKKKPVEQIEPEYKEVPVVDYDDFIEIDYTEPEIKKVKTEPEVTDDITDNEHEQNTYMNKFINFVNFDGNVKQEQEQEVEVKAEDDEDDDGDEEGQIIYDSITIKEECIM